MKSFALMVLFLTSASMLAQTPAPADATAPQRIQVPEAWAMGQLLEVVQPPYPEEARKKNVGGKVVVRIAIDRAGMVIEAVPIQGDPLLLKAAASAVMRWKFRPYIRDSEKVEVETTATLEFTAETGEVRAPKPSQGPLRLRVSSDVAERSAIKHVDPHYPPEAVAKRLQGDILLSGVIGRDGNVKDLKVINGHPLLAEAAMKAVMQWQYKPYTLNGEPVEMETTIKVKFRL